MTLCFFQNYVASVVHVVVGGLVKYFPFYQNCEITYIKKDCFRHLEIHFTLLRVSCYCNELPFKNNFYISFKLW